MYYELDFELLFCEIIC